MGYELQALASLSCPFFFFNIDNKIVLPESESESGRIL